MPDLFNEDEMTGDGMTYMEVVEEARERAFSEAMDADRTPSATVDYWVYGAALQAADELRARLAAAEQRATDAEATLATIGGADKATLARKLRRANAATRDAEQRATMSDAHMADAYRLVDEVMHLADRALYSDDPAERMEKAGQLQTLWNLTLQEALAATAPATQPDERAAKERAVIETALRLRAATDAHKRHGKMTLEEIARTVGFGHGDTVWAEVRAAKQAHDEAVGALLALNATDGAAKEGT